MYHKTCISEYKLSLSFHQSSTPTVTPFCPHSSIHFSKCIAFCTIYRMHYELNTILNYYLFQKNKTNKQIVSDFSLSTAARSLYCDQYHHLTDLMEIISNEYIMMSHQKQFTFWYNVPYQTQYTTSDSLEVETGSESISYFYTLLLEGSRDASSLDAEIKIYSQQVHSI